MRISNVYFLGLQLSAFLTELTFGIILWKVAYLRSYLQFSPTSESVICTPHTPLFHSEARKWVASVVGAGSHWTWALGGKNPLVTK